MANHLFVMRGFLYTVESVMWKILLQVFGTFFKIGSFTFGGGYAMIPLIQREVVQKHKWITDEDILEIVAIAESTPGPIAINAATFVGYRTAGVTGAFMATLGVVIPSFVIIYVIASVLREFQDFRAVSYAFFGIRAGVLALIVKACISMLRQNTKGMKTYGIVLFAFVSAAVFQWNVLLVIVLCAVTGLVLSMGAVHYGDKIRKGGKRS